MQYMNNLSTNQQIYPWKLNPITRNKKFNIEVSFPNLLKSKSQVYTKNKNSLNSSIISHSSPINPLSIIPSLYQNQKLDSIQEVFKSNDIGLVKKLETKNHQDPADIFNPFLSEEKIRQSVDENIDVISKRKGKNSKEDLPRLDSHNKCKWLNDLMSAQKKNNQKTLFDKSNKSFESLVYEKKTLSEIEELKTKYENVKKEREQIVRLVNIENEKISQMNHDMELLTPEFARKILSKKLESNNTNPVPVNRTSKKNFPKMFQSPHEKEQNENKEKESQFLSRFNQLLNYQSIKTQKEEFANKIKESEGKIKNYEKEIEKFKPILEDYRDKIQSKSNQLMSHYSHVLYEGLDVRQEGLCWVIRAIWSMGKNVPMEFFPSFLDANSILYLFRYTNITIKLLNAKNRIEEIKLKLKNHLISIGALSNARLLRSSNVNMGAKNKKIDTDIDIDIDGKNTIENEKDNNLLERGYGNNKNDAILLNNGINGEDLKKNEDDFFRTSIFHTDDKFFSNKEQNSKEAILKKCFSQKKVEKIKNMSKEEKLKNLVSNVMNRKSKFDQEAIVLIKQMEDLNKMVKETEEVLSKARTEEVDRILSEYMENDYEKKSNACIEIVISALVGERYKHEEINRVMKKRKLYFDNIKNIQFFNCLPTIPKTSGNLK